MSAAIVGSCQARAKARPRARRRSRRCSAAREHALLVDRIEPERAQLGDAGVELVAREGAGGRDDGDAIAGPQRARLAHALSRHGEPRHLGGDRLVLVAAEQRAQRRRRSAARGRGGARNRSFTRRWRVSASSTRFSGSVPSRRRGSPPRAPRSASPASAPHISTASQPAAIAATVASRCRSVALIAFISRSSVTTSPW